MPQAAVMLNIKIKWSTLCGSCPEPWKHIWHEIAAQAGHEININSMRRSCRAAHTPRDECTRSIYRDSHRWFHNTQAQIAHRTASSGATDDAIGIFIKGMHSTSVVVCRIEQRMLIKIKPLLPDVVFVVVSVVTLKNQLFRRRMNPFKYFFKLHATWSYALASTNALNRWN